MSFESKSPGVAIVSVAWRNPTLNRVIQAFFVVASGVIVDSADTMTLTNDQTMLISAPTALRANTYVGTTVFPSNAVVAAAYLQGVGVQLTAQSVGTSFVNIELPRDSAGIQHLRVMIVYVVPSARPAVY